MLTSTVWEEKYLLLVLLLQRQKLQVPDKGHGLYQLQQALPWPQPDRFLSP